MVLGQVVIDPTSIEGATTGIGLLPLTTTMDESKHASRVVVHIEDMPEPWSSLNGISATGYEIRNGRISVDGHALGEQLWVDGSVLATTVHGLLEDPAVLEALTGHRPQPILESTFELLADAVETHLDTELLLEMVNS